MVLPINRFSYLGEPFKSLDDKVSAKAATAVSEVGSLEIQLRSSLFSFYEYFIICWYWTLIYITYYTL